MLYITYSITNIYKYMNYTTNTHILVLGHNGWIGKMMIELLKKQQIEYVTTNIRPENKKDFEEELLSMKPFPTHIMSFIGRTHGKIGEKSYSTIDYLEQKGKLRENVRDNLFSPLVVALLCKKYNIHYTYLGTGCIFTYDESHPYGNTGTGFKEEEIPNFFGSSYSIVKGYTDELMHLLDSHVLNLRIRMPITSKDEPRNFITKIKSYEYVCSIPNSMTVLDELLPYVIDMAQKKITGSINLTNPGVITHNELLEMYRKYVDPEFSWKNFTIEEQDVVLDAQRSNNCLATTKLENLYPNVKNIRESVEDVFVKWNK
jgi:3,5-epimerase/4-reductase